MKTLLLLLCGLLLSTISSTSQIVVNEFQPNPVDDEPEWIELFNTSDQSVVDAWYYLHDTKSVIRIQHVDIRGLGYAVVTSDSTLLKNHRIIPPDCKIIEAKIPSLNNTTDVIVFRGPDSSVIDSVFYNVKWVKKGISFERKFADRPATSQSNLFASSSVDSATCGYTNSVSPRRIDASIRTLNFSKDNSMLMVELYNEGIEAIPDGEITLYLDTNHNQKADLPEKVRTMTFKNLNMNDSLIFTIPTDEIQSHFMLYGEVNFLAICYANGDTQTTNDTARIEAFLSYPEHSILINELLYDPESRFAEFIELYNNSSFTIDLNKWQLHDKATSSGADTLHLLRYIFHPNTYCVIAWDSTFFDQFPELLGAENVIVLPTSMSLNSDGDVIALRDGNGLLIDSLNYSSTWHDKSLSSTKGVSLEKIKPNFPSIDRTSWSSCGDFRVHSTPTKANSLALNFTTEDSLIAIPNPFSPTSGNLHQTIISFTLKSSKSVVNAVIYNKEGIAVSTILNTEYSSSQGAVTWNGKDSAGNSVTPGSYILVLEITDRITGESRVRNLLIVVGK